MRARDVTRRGRPWAAAFYVAFLLGGCNTVDLGDNFVAPDVQLDEGFFYCRVQPEVITAYKCAGGGAGEGGSCHTARSALRLSLEAETATPPTCEGPEDAPRATNVPPSYMMNLEAARLAVQTDPLSSPLYRRPLGLDSHPRAIFAASDPAATIIRDWIARGAR